MLPRSAKTSGHLVGFAESPSNFLQACRTGTVIPSTVLSPGKERVMFPPQTLFWGQGDLFQQLSPASEARAGLPAHTG